jgi:hypothetical protein
LREHVAFRQEKESLGGEGHRASDYEQKFDARAGIAGAEFNGNLEETTKCLLLNSPSVIPESVARFYKKCTPDFGGSERSDL